MKQNLEFGRILNSEELQELGTILSQCFNMPASVWQKYSQRLGQDSFRYVRQANQIVGGLGIYHMGQWFGGKQLAMAGLAAVGVAPEYRGTGIVFQLLTQTLRELYNQGVPISVLYPATQRPYRKVGYEQGGTFCNFKLPTNSIKLAISEEAVKEIRSLPMQRVNLIRPEAFYDVYRQQAIKNNGNLERNQAIWARVIEPEPNREIYAYLVGNEAQPEGYIIFKQQSENQLSQVVISDWVALTPAAAKRLWVFLGDHRSIAQEVLWHGSLNDPFVSLLAEQTSKIVSCDRWLLRIINVPQALAQRGYPVGVEAELHLEVHDELLPENHGKFVLRVSNGQGEVIGGGSGELKLNVRGLASLYTGLFSPHQLLVSGQLEGSDRALATASLLFAGSHPWMRDFF